MSVEGASVRSEHVSPFSPEVPARTGAQALVGCLERLGVEVVFGLPGGALLPFYDALVGSSLRHVLMRHEQGAGHAAEGYAHATGRPGVCVATSGPGATNLVTPLADAYMDSIPLVAITGQVNRAVIGKDAFQEADITGITLPITKHSFKVRSPEEIPAVVAKALELATSGRPGPVLIDVPKDVQAARMSFDARSLPALDRSSSLQPDAGDVQEAVELLLKAERPVVYVGGGVIKADASRELRVLVDLLGAPVVTTLMARGALPDSHPLCLGMPGMHGSYAAVTAMQRSDLLIALGARFDDRVTGRLDGFAPGAKVIHVDVDATEISKNRRADVGLVADARTALLALNEELADRVQWDHLARVAPWRKTVKGWRERYPLFYKQTGILKPQFVIERLGALTRGEAIVTTGVGQHRDRRRRLLPNDLSGACHRSRGAHPHYRSGAK